ncbi:tRNA (uracil-5-)-methyltransferase homolog B [Anguilla rostrata]|uniref:tRNA (uracil-5-)-methyltransferase homolog B n=1 Tax=Anguilla rostrata TaxID=7938 RepID=UPI0030D498C1
MQLRTVFRCKQHFRAAYTPGQAHLSSSVKDVITSKDPKRSIGALAEKKKRRKHVLPQIGESVSWEERVADAVTPLWRLSYEQQLQLKQERQEDIVRHLSEAGAYRCPPVLPIRPSPVTDGYRNKSTFSVNAGPGGDPKTVGFYVGTGKARNIVCVRADHLKNIPEKHKLVARRYEEFLRLSPLDPCLLFHTGGHWREIMVRTNSAGHTMAVVFFHPQTMAPDKVQLHKAALLEYFTQGPGAVCQLDSLYFQACPMTRCSHQQAPFQLLYGASHIYEDLLGLRFRISPDAFFQVNTAGAEVLYNSVRELSALGEVCRAIGELSDVRDAGLGGATLLDVCCGAGVIGISMASAVDRVIGVEIVEQAVEDARYNAALNQAWNCHFLSGKAEEVLPRLLPSLSSNQGLVVVANPSRAGLHYRTVRALRNLPSIRRLVYVSCKPEGEATRNFLELCCPADPQKKLTGEPFTMMAALPVDMFPHTLHCELLLLFQR